MYIYGFVFVCIYLGIVFKKSMHEYSYFDYIAFRIHIEKEKNKEKINKTKKRKEKEKASHILKTTYNAKKVDHEFNKIANMA